MLKGTPASAGIGIGKVLLIRQDKIVVIKRIIQDKYREKKRFTDAVDSFCTQISAQTEAVSRNIGEAEAGIISVQSVIAEDPELLREVFEWIDKESVSVEYAFSVVCDRYIRLFESLEDELMSARAADFRDIKNRMLSIMLGIRNKDFQHVPVGSVLVAEDISPSQAAMLDPSRVSAIVTQDGTRFSHISIIVRALQIPAVVSVNNICGSVAEGDDLIVDGEKGEVLRNPTVSCMTRYRKRQTREQHIYEKLKTYKNKQTLTMNGKRVMLDANLSVVQELCGISENNVDGIGLFRTEFLFMGVEQLPSEEKQFKTYQQVVQALAGRHVVIRTLDVGGDKVLSSIDMELGSNPFLGNRAIRFCLSHPDIFKTQIAALLRASAFGELWILLPMISSLGELHAAKKLIAEVKEELTAQNIPIAPRIPIGIMIETPAAAMCADFLAPEADFFSIGTNDLTQYTLAVDRGNQSVASLYSSLHPAVLRLIRNTVEGAKKAGIMVGVCGEAASDPLMVPLLVGLGVDELSVTSRSVLWVRQQIAGLDSEYWSKAMDEVLKLATPGEIAEFVRSTTA